MKGWEKDAAQQQKLIEELQQLKKLCSSFSGFMVPAQTNQQHDRVFTHNQLSNGSSLGIGARHNRVPLGAICAKSLDLSSSNFNNSAQPPPCLGETTCSWHRTRCVQAQVEFGSVPTCESEICDCQKHGRRCRKLPGLDSCELSEPLTPINESDGSWESGNPLTRDRSASEHLHRLQNTAFTSSNRAQGQILSSSYLRAVLSPRPHPPSSSIVQRPLVLSLQFIQSIHSKILRLG